MADKFCWLTPFIFAENSNFIKRRGYEKTGTRDFFNSMKRIGEHGLLKTLILDYKDKAIAYLEKNNLPTNYAALCQLNQSELDALPVEAKHIYEMLHSFYIVQEKIKANDAELAAWNMAKGILSAMRAEVMPIEPFFDIVIKQQENSLKTRDLKKYLMRTAIEQIFKEYPNMKKTLGGVWNKIDILNEKMPVINPETGKKVSIKTGKDEKGKAVIFITGDGFEFTPYVKRSLQHFIDQLK